MENLLRYWDSVRRRLSGKELPAVRWVSAVLAFACIGLVSPVAGRAQSTGDSSPNSLQPGPRCPTCPIVVAARPLSAKDKEDRVNRSSEKNNYSAANAQRKLYIDDETNRMLILVRDLKAKIDGLGTGRPTPTMLREAAVIEFLAKDIKEKMRLTINPD